MPEPNVTEQELQEAENQILDALGQIAGLIDHLPKKHPMDNHEMSHAIHRLQDMVAARRFWRANGAKWTRDD